MSVLSSLVAYDTQQLPIALINAIIVALAVLVTLLVVAIGQSMSASSCSSYPSLPASPHGGVRCGAEDQARADVHRLHRVTRPAGIDGSPDEIPGEW